MTATATTFSGPPAETEQGVGALTIGGLLAQACAEHAGREAVAAAAGDGTIERWTYDELASFSDRMRAVIDCTGGWYSEQEWEGVWLTRLLPPDQLDGALSVSVRSTTGYPRRFDVADISRLLLATRVGGSELASGNGYPARLVAPGMRGFWWVKWVVELRPEPVPWWWQSPYPLQ